jgi:hypothetical protein
MSTTPRRTTTRANEVTRKLRYDARRLVEQLEDDGADVHPVDVARRVLTLHAELIEQPELQAGRARLESELADYVRDLRVSKSRRG